jgi:hypothetical protein
MITLIEEREQQSKVHHGTEVQEFLTSKWLRVGEGIQAEWSGEGQTVEGRPETLPETWNRNGDTLAAVGLDGELYVTPFSDSVYQGLNALGFTKDERLGVPLFHDEEIATEESREKWSRLRSLARIERIAQGKGEE